MPVEVGTVLAMERWRFTSQPTRAGQQHQIQNLLKCLIPKTTRKAPSGVRTSSPATNGIAAFAVTASCTRRRYANTLLMSITRPCRQACTSTSTAQFGSERNSHDLALNAARTSWNTTFPLRPAARRPDLARRRSWALSARLRTGNGLALVRAEGAARRAVRCRSEVSRVSPCWREHLKNLLAARSVRITTPPLLTQLAASAGHRAPEAGRLHSAPRYQPHRAQAHSVLRHAMHPGTVGPPANRPRPHPPVGTGSRPRSCNHRSASRSRCSVRRQNNLGI